VRSGQFVNEEGHWGEGAVGAKKTKRKKERKI
jgi:hypothetical protein